MLAPKNHESSKAEPKAPGRAKPKNSETKTSPFNPLWHQLATRVETPASYEAGVFQLPVQAKLTVGSPNDPYEQEADRVADAVMRMPEPEIRRKPT